MLLSLSSHCNLCIMGHFLDKNPGSCLILLDVASRRTPYSPRDSWWKFPSFSTELCHMFHLISSCLPGPSPFWPEKRDCSEAHSPSTRITSQKNKNNWWQSHAIAQIETIITVTVNSLFYLAHRRFHPSARGKSKKWTALLKHTLIYPVTEPIKMASFNLFEGSSHSQLVKSQL